MTSEVSSPEPAEKDRVERLLMNLVNSDPPKFMFFFKLLRERFPTEAIGACASIMGLNEATPPAQHVLAWSNYEKYFDLLLDPDFLSFDQVKRAASVLRENDPRFFAKFTLYADRVKGRNTSGLLRALALLEAAGDYSVLFSWLRNLINHENENVRSKAAKMMCKVSPSRSVIERQLKSEDSRVRANAIEALWFSQDPDRTDVFRNALLDKAHRVVVNAIVGLYYQDQENAMAKLLKLSEHSSEAFRAAAIWGFGFLMDVRAMPALEALQRDESETVREKAEKLLASLLEKQKQVCAA